MSRIQKISETIDLQSIYENNEEHSDDEVFKTNVVTSKEKIHKDENPPPQIPDKNVDIESHFDYLDNALSWLRKELKALQRQDKDLVSAYTNLITTVNKLKKVKNTFEEQSYNIDRVHEQKSLHERNSSSDILCDLPNNENKLEQRYKRIGLQERLFSFS